VVSAASAAAEVSAVAVAVAVAVAAAVGSRYVRACAILVAQPALDGDL
jgi:hypothetical protein